MSRKYEDLITRHNVRLTRDLVVNTLFMAVLKAKSVVIPSEAEEIEELSKSKQRTKVLNLVPKRGLRGWQGFIAALMESGQEDLGYLLDREEADKWCKENAGEHYERFSHTAHGQRVTEPTPSSKPPPSSSNPPPPKSTSEKEPFVRMNSYQPSDENKDETNDKIHQEKEDENMEISSSFHNLGSGKVAQVENDDALKILENEEEVYSIKHILRGRVLIITMHKLLTEDDKDMNNMNNTNLGSLFDGLQFKGDFKDVATVKELKALLKREADKMTKEHDAFALIIKAKGKDRNTILDQEGNKITADEITEFFNVTNCPHLKGKPKVLLLQLTAEEASVTEGMADLNIGKKSDDDIDSRTVAMEDLLIVCSLGKYPSHEACKDEFTFLDVFIHLSEKSANKEDLSTILARAKAIGEKKNQFSLEVDESKFAKKLYVLPGYLKIQADSMFPTM